MPSSSSGDARSLVCTEPGFIQNFFQSSRLHHLSIWKADLIEFAAQTMESTKQGRRVSSADQFPRIIMHVDMDCFFASVGLRDRPHLVGKLVAVAHSTGGMHLDHSSSEIASCNYEARARGVKNGMFLGSVKEIAPELEIIPYEFDKYDAVSRILYQILTAHSDFVQAVSCDEAYIDVTFMLCQQLKQEGYTIESNSTGLHDTLQQLSVQHAENIRREIHQATNGCCASIGISHNLLLARLATTKAKPNNVAFLSANEAQVLLQSMAIKELPGVGYSTSEKCKQLELHTCGDIQAASHALLRRELGEKTGDMIRAFALGIDHRVLENKARQSLGADINWGIRFTDNAQIDLFLREFSNEVFLRLDNGGWTAAHVTVNAKKKLYEGEPAKFLGCGHCADYSRSQALQQSITSAEGLFRVVIALFREMQLPPLEVRGLGIHLKKLKKKFINNVSGNNLSFEGGKPQQQTLLKFAKNCNALNNPAADHSTNSQAMAAPPEKVQTAIIDTINENEDDDLEEIETIAQTRSGLSSGDRAAEMRAQRLQSYFSSSSSSTSAKTRSYKSKAVTYKPSITMTTFLTSSSTTKKRPQQSSLSTAGDREFDWLYILQQLPPDIDREMFLSLSEELRHEQLQMMGINYSKKRKTSSAT